MDEVLTREERERVERTRKCVSLSPCGTVTDLLTIIDRLTAELAASKRHGDTVSELCEKLEKALTSTADENARLTAELAKARSELARTRECLGLVMSEVPAVDGLTPPECVRQVVSELAKARSVEGDVCIGSPSAVMYMADVEAIVREQAYALVERDLRSAGVKVVRLDGPPNDDRDFVELYTRDVTMTSAEDKESLTRREWSEADTLAGAFAKLEGE